MTSNESGLRTGSPTRLAPITVLAVGNTIMGDDGLGPAVLAALSAARAEDPRVLLVDGGTLGMSLLPVIQDARRLLVLDAVDVPGDPGDVVTLAGDQLPRLLSSKLSPRRWVCWTSSPAPVLGSEPERVAGGRRARLGRPALNSVLPWPLRSAGGGHRFRRTRCWSRSTTCAERAAGQPGSAPVSSGAEPGHG